MTTIFTRTIHCAVCGAPNDVTLIGSTNTMGPPDLDTRPAEMQRSTMPLWLQECGGCGFIARDLQRPHAGTDERLRSEAYKAQRHAEYPELANRFLCAAMLLEGTWATAGAFWNVMAAAWACDDAGRDDLAQRCRLKAIELHAASTEPIAKQDGVSDLVLADLLRRTSQFEKVADVVRRGLEFAEPFVATGLRQELSLASAGDAGGVTSPWTSRGSSSGGS